MGLTTPTQTQACPMHKLIRAAWNEGGKEQRGRTIAPWLVGQRYRPAIGTGPAPVFLSVERTSWFQCTVPGGVKGCCWAPLFMRAVDTRWSPWDVGWFPPYFADSRKWGKHYGWAPLPRAWELHVFGNEVLCIMGRSVPTLQWNDMHRQWREHITKKRCFSETSHTTGTKEERK